MKESAEHVEIYNFSNLPETPKSPTEINNFSPDPEITNFDKVFSLPKKVISLVCILFLAALIIRRHSEADP